MEGVLIILYDYKSIILYLNLDRKPSLGLYIDTPCR